MKFEQFASLVKAMKAVYSDPKFIADKEAIMVWYEFFRNDDYMVIQASIQKYMATNKFPPTIADIRQGATELISEKEMSEGEAWSLVYKAISNASYRAKEEFEKLPEECKKAIGSPALLKEWSQMDMSQVNTVIQSNFLKSYRIEKQRAKELAQLPSSTRQLISKVLENTRMITKKGNND